MSEKSPRAQKEERILKFWQDNKIFEKSLEKESPKGEFVFYDGPPFATGLPHYGHILPGTVKDVIPRYKTMKGYHVPRRWGWDCHGLPIENLVEKELGLETKKDIEKFGIAEFNKRARESVLTFEQEWKEIVPRTGRWVDMDQAYKTMDTSYTEAAWWAFKELHNKDLVYQGFKVMPLCPHCGTTLSNFEVNQGYKDITDISVYAKFELVDEPGIFFLAWTTTPWTLPGNVALAVNSELVYVKVRIANELFILAKERLSVLKEQQYEIVESFVGKDLAGKKYKTPFDYYVKEGQVYVAEFVSAEEGTGIVHIAPAFGEDDYNLSLKENLPLIQHVDTDGRFKSEVTDFAGKAAKPKEDHQAGDVEIIKYLAAKNLLFAKEKIVHSYPHCWRCDTPLLNYASSSWFVKVTEIKDKLVKNNGKVKWVPREIGEGRFGKWLEGARDWAVSRSRFWGTPIPVWQNADSTKMLVVDSLEMLKKYSKPAKNSYLIMRHGGTAGNQQELVSFKDEAQDHLTEKGIEQVRASAEKLKKEKIDLIVHSPFARTTETAKIVQEMLGLSDDTLVSDARLHEMAPGALDGHDWNEYHRLIAELGPDWFYKSVEGGESFAQVQERIGSCLYDLEKQYEGKKILIVTHGGPAWMFFVTAGEHRPEDKEYRVPNFKDNDTEIFVSGFPRFHNAEVRELPFVPLPHNEKFVLDLHRPYIDKVVLEKDGEEYKRIPEIFDTWYDSGSVPFASRRARESKPADFIAEGLDQTRGWFYTLLVLSTALFGESPYKQVVVNGLILAEDGKKMSKRLKNYPELTDVLDKYGADALRYYLVSSPAVRAEDLAFSEKGLDEVVKKIINRTENMVSFYELYAGEQTSEGQSKHLLDRWADARLAKFVEEVTKHLENYELDRASRPIEDFVDDLSTWYLRRSRTRPEALPKLRSLLLSFAQVLAPFMPFLAEDIYLRLKMSESAESVHLEKWPEAEKTDQELLDKMEQTRGVVTLALEARAKANIKVRQPLAKLEIKTKLPEEYLEIIKDELNVKSVEVNENLSEEVSLDTALTPELLEEGKVRDAIRAIQEWRKEQNLKPGEQAQYTIPNEQKDFFKKHSDEIKRSTNVEFN